jgi:membrane associated rhomboid family serine protease
LTRVRELRTLNGVNRTPLIRRPFPPAQYNVVLILVGINAAIFIITRFLAQQTLPFLGMIPAYVLQGNFWWQLVTYMFVHASIGHIFFNMLALFLFGVQVEQRLGSHEFLSLYMFTGIMAGVFSLVFYVVTGSYGVFLVGASGAVFGVLLAFATLYPEAMIYIFGIIPVRAPILVLGYTVISLFFGVSGGGGNVAHFTHLAGFAFAYLYFLVRLGINPIAVFIDHYR